MTKDFFANLSIEEKRVMDSYDSTDQKFRQIFDLEGNLHYAIFDLKRPITEETFKDGIIETTRQLINKGNFSEESRVLDVCCGNGNTAFMLSEASQAQIIGVDISSIKIQNAQNSLNLKSAKVQEKVQFIQASANQLPFEEKYFSHVISQSALYHVQNNRKAFDEIVRVLKKDGIFIFDDLIRPQLTTSEASKHIYERLMSNIIFTFESYKEFLTSLGFQILFSEERSKHMQNFYLYSSQKCSKLGAKMKEYADLTLAYENIAAAIGRRELGWAFYVCQIK